jgi:hypothetical protein
MENEETFTLNQFADLVWTLICKWSDEIRTELLKEPSIAALELSYDEKELLQREIGVSLMWVAFQNVPEGQLFLDRLHDNYLPIFYQSGTTEEEKLAKVREAHSQLIERYNKYREASIKDSKSECPIGLSIETLRNWIPRPDYEHRDPFLWAKVQIHLLSCGSTIRSLRQRSRLASDPQESPVVPASKSLKSTFHRLRQMLVKSFGKTYTPQQVSQFVWECIRQSTRLFRKRLLAESAIQQVQLSEIENAALTREVCISLLYMACCVIPAKVADVLIPEYLVSYSSAGSGSESEKAEVYQLARTELEQRFREYSNEAVRASLGLGTVMGMNWIRRFHWQGSGIADSLTSQLTAFQQSIKAKVDGFPIAEWQRRAHRR